MLFKLKTVRISIQRPQILSRDSLREKAKGKLTIGGETGRAKEDDVHRIPGLMTVSNLIWPSLQHQKHSLNITGVAKVK